MTNLVPPELPIPNPEEVEEFKKLFLFIFGEELSDEAAYDAARRLVQFVFLTQYAVPHFKGSRGENGSETLPPKVV